MGRSPCCDEDGLKKGPWTPEEDKKLVDYIHKNGHGSWRALPKLAGLNRCGKSCRLRWTNYLRPDIKRGKFSQDEEQTILNLHSILGNKWSAIASHLPGRTDNEIKNFWNTHLKKKLIQMGFDPMTHQPRTDLFATLPQLMALVQLKDLLLDHTSSSSNPLDHQTMRLQAEALQLAKLQYVQYLLQSSSSTSSPSPHHQHQNGAVSSDMELINLLNSLLGQVMSCPILQIEKKKVGDRMLDMTESNQTKVKDRFPSFEFKSSHCKDMMYTKEQLYISKSPSLKFCSAHNFVSLFFSYSKRPQLWKGGEQHLVSLKCLDAKHSDLLWIPDLSKAQKLESLNLEGCANLVGISSIQYLTKLQHLNLKGCQSLKGVPSLIRLKLLKTFDLSDCSNLTRLPPSLGCLPNLSELNLKNCAKLANLPRSVIHLMKSLETLNISGCSSMWKYIGDYQDGAVPSLAKPYLGFSVMPSTEARHRENLPNSNSDIPANKESSREPQLLTAEQVDVVAEGSLSQDLSLDLKDIRGKKAVEREEEAFPRTPLISSLLSELRRALLLPPNVGSSHASTSSSHDINIQTINHTQNNKSEAEQSEIATLLQMEDQQQQLSNDDDHDDAKTVETKPLSAATEPILCQVEDCQIDLSGAETYHQQHKICEIHCMATAALLGNILQRFCHQCCRFHVLCDFDEEERNCRNRLAGHHQKQRRQRNAATIGTEEEHSTPETTDLDAEINIADSEGENEKCLLHKRIKTVDPPEQNQPTVAVEQQSFNDWDEANAIGDIEDRVLEMIEQVSRSNYADDDEKAAAAVPESVLDLVAEMEQTVPETVRSMKSAKAKATADSAEWKVADARLVIGELELRLLDMELTRISEEEEEIEAELQRLMDQKRELSQQ